MAARRRIELLDQATTRPLVYAYGDGRDLLPVVKDLGRDAGELRAVEGRIRSHVQQLRAGGASWAVIGHALGVTKQAAAARFGREELV